jgi:hypothetical protein
MFLLQLSPSRFASSRAAFIAILVLLCLALSAAPVAAAGPGETAVSAAAPVAFINDIVGNRTRMIQIACVIGAIGIFFLTRSYR